ncbi:phenylacetate-coenzyme A ligase [Kordiimonas sediminis]|uniref:Phenylacetate-coenzyme A ligase n=1 Tax=Kordiimonas sediminis TaxID=1735581 RepID=A0A919AJ33_9PROT|nr:phenylacetate--CoA ligase PaaK [Kordiimonas sediminis]GHF10986.1 phenylacetate-coenzyme A ligase [Kordiimonas sediminis]
MHVHFDDTIIHIDRDRLKEIQLHRMQKSIRHAYDNVAHYRATFKEAGVTPDDLQSLDDLAKFPFLTKQDMRNNYPYGLTAVPMEDVVRTHASSGTTGQATVVTYTKRDIDMWADVVARSIRAAGGNSSDTVHVAYGYGLFTGGLGAHYGAERAGCNVIPMSGGATARQVDLIMDFKPTIIMVTPSYMLALADGFRKAGIDPRDTSLRIAIHGAEPWTEEMRREIEETFDLDAVDIYGLSEVIGPGVGQEFASTKDGPTIWEDHFYPEIINPETGEVLPDGEEGELVFTSLTKEAFPIIRYRTRDLTRLLPPTACSMRRMAKITGRSDDMMIIRGVNVFPMQIEDLILKDSRLVPHYYCEIRREGPMDTLTVVGEAAEHAADENTRIAASQQLAHAIKATIGVSSTVVIKEPNAIPRSEGKAKRVHDLRNK